MKNTLLALFIVPLLTMPAFAGSSNAGDKPMVVAQAVDVRVGGVGVDVGERHRHRDRGAIDVSTRGHRDHGDLYMSNRGHRDHRDDHR